MSVRRCCRPRQRRFWHRWFGHPIARPAREEPRRASTTDDARTRIIADYHAHTTLLARERIIALVRSGHHIGPMPYGYRAIRGHHRRHRSDRPGTRLQPDPRTASTVPTIYFWRLDQHLSLPAIVNRLTADPDHCPAPTDPVTGRPRPWTVGVVHTILGNPVYTGRTVWGRTRHGRPLPHEHWITSGPGAHRALIDDRTFARATATVATRTRVPRGGFIQRDLVDGQREPDRVRPPGPRRDGSGGPENWSP